MTLEEELAASREASAEIMKMLVQTAVSAETAMRVLLALANRTGVSDVNLIQAMMLAECEVVDELKAGKFDVTKFVSRPGEEWPDFLIAANGEAPHAPDTL